MKANQTTRVKGLVLLFLTITVLAMVGLGCNTAHGFGKDVEKAGQGIQRGTK
jgi:predicted small secreted protein